MAVMQFLLFFIVLFPLSVYATDTGTVSANLQVHVQQGPTTPRADPGVFGMYAGSTTSNADPRPGGPESTSFPLTMSGTEADTQFGRGTVSGFSEASIDQTTPTVNGDFQSVVNRMNSSGAGSSRVNQLQTQIHQNQAQAGYIFDNNFSVTSVTDQAGNMVGQAKVKYIRTYQEVVGGIVRTTTCVGGGVSERALNSDGTPAFYSDGTPKFTYTNTDGTNSGISGSGCKTN
jgi:hypothetical protein